MNAPLLAIGILMESRKLGLNMYTSKIQSVYGSSPVSLHFVKGYPFTIYLWIQET